MEPVLDRLLISCLSEAHDPFVLENQNIQAILYYGDGGLFPEDIKLYHRSLETEKRDTEDLLSDGIEFLRESLRRGRRVLAVGPWGVTITAAYLMETGFSRKEALRMVRGDFSPKPDMELLTRFEMTLGHRAATSPFSVEPHLLNTT